MTTLLTKPGLLTNASLAAAVAGGDGSSSQQSSTPELEANAAANCLPVVIDDADNMEGRSRYVISVGLSSRSDQTGAAEKWPKSSTISTNYTVYFRYTASRKSRQDEYADRNESACDVAVTIVRAAAAIAIMLSVVVGQRRDQWAGAGFWLRHEKGGCR